MKVNSKLVTLLTSPEVWAVILGAVVMLLGKFVPSFKLDVDGLVAVVVVICTYVLGVIIDPSPTSWSSILQSRKFWAAVVGMVMIVLTGFKITPFMDPEQLLGLCVVIGSFISAIALDGRFNPPPPNFPTDPPPDVPRTNINFVG